MSEKWMNTKEYFVTYSIIINAARHHGFATYQEIAQANGLPTSGNYMSSVVGELLGLVSKHEIEQGRPMLSAIAISVNGKPGPGFIPWAIKLGVLHEGEDEEIFWENECQNIYEEWKIPYRISKTK